MKLIVCRKEIESPYKAATRIKIVQQYGEEFEIACWSCNNTYTYEVDDIRAEDYTFWEIIINRLKLLLATFFVSAILGMFLFDVFAGFCIGLVCSLIYALYAKRNNSNSNLTFNKHKVKGRMTNIGS